MLPLASRTNVPQSQGFGLSLGRRGNKTLQMDSNDELLPVANEQIDAKSIWGLGY